MLGCGNCGQDNPSGAAFCRACGQKIASRAPERPPTPRLAGAGAQAIDCPSCGATNPHAMNFCRNCGSLLQPAARVSSPVDPEPRPRTTAPVTSAPAIAPAPKVGEPALGSPAVPQEGASAPARPATGPTWACPHCHQQTPEGFGFCQRCGRRVSEPTPPRAAALSEVEIAPTGPATILQNEPPLWGSLVSVNRDQSDGARHVLRGESVILGRGDADICFSEDTFLAGTHAVVHHGESGPVVEPIDRVNGVYFRIRGPVDIGDHAMFLVGRELLEFERLREEDRTIQPLLRHGVLTFGGPWRRPWARLRERLSNGSEGSVYYLHTEEFTIGREGTNLVFEDDVFLSRVHAVMQRRGSGCLLVDKNSSNGTFVRIEGKRALTPGDSFRIGDQLLRYEDVRG